MTQEQIRLRRILMVTISSIVLAAIFLIDWFDLFDPALIVYHTTLMFMIFCLVFWIYWGMRSADRASTIFKVNGLLIASIALNLIFEIYARWNAVYNFEVFKEILATTVWKYRHIPTLLIFIWLLSWIMSRLISTTSVKWSSRDGLKKG